MKVATEIKLPIEIRNNKFASNLNMIKTILEHYNNNTIDVTFKKRSNKRSNQQNAYYWSVIITIFNNCIKEEWGELWSIQETHNFLLTNCNFEEIVNEDTGEILRVVRRSKDNTVSQAEEYYEKCRRLAKDFFDTEIPIPNEEMQIKY